MFRGETISQVMARCSNRPAGFDYLRLILSTGVVLSHTSNTLYGEAGLVRVLESPLRIPIELLMPLFFSLSGFLVAGSLERCRTVISFVGLRLLRLVPALTVDTVIAALVLGPVFTSLPLAEYFADPLFHHYWLNIVGDPQYFLPGVFAHNPTPGLVNGQLWTLPSELKCYVALTLLALLRITSARTVFLVSTVAIYAAFFAYDGLHPEIQNGHQLIECFLFGVAAFLFRDRVPLSWPLAVSAALLIVALIDLRGGGQLIVVPAVYVTVFAGMLNPRRTKVVSSGDYSYGIFLYGMPIQAAVTAVLGQIPWPLHFLVSYAIIVCFACMSWWLVEKPALKLRPWLYALERRASDTILRLPLGIHLVQPPVGPRLQRPPARQI